jgi:Domain of unknown function (DUF4263)
MSVKASRSSDSYENPKPGFTYISPSLPSFSDETRRIRIATKAIDTAEGFAFAEVKGEVVLRHKEGGQNCIKAKFLEDDRGIYLLSIQGYTAATLRPHNASFSFMGEEIGRLVEFINHVQSMPLKHTGAMRIADGELRRLVLTQTQAASLVRDNEELFKEVIRQALTKEDLVAIGYRKRQLGVFERLLSEDEFFEQTKTRLNCSPEALWQRFFEKNPWIFGYGLQYIYVSGWDSQKLEQVVSGSMAFKPGKRADALMRSRGVLSNLCFVEIKTHKTDLLEERAYRSGCFAPSSELIGAVSQVQGTVSRATEDIRTKLTGKSEAGDPTGEEAYNYMPKSFLVVGSLQQFIGEHGVNEDRHRSFELFRGNTLRPEILTFDELLERARFIVQQHETQA